MHNSLIKCYIDPRCKVNYASFYIKGLYDIIGKKNVCFNSKKFKNYKELDNYHSQWNGMSIIIENNNSIRKIYIDYHDPDTVLENAYKWCDVYAKVNVNFADLNKYKKLVPIGPGFGIDIFNWYEILYYQIVNFIKCFPTLKISKKQFLLDYLYIKIRRKPLDYYKKSNSELNYVFSLSTLWYDKYAIENTNKFRFKFCKSVINNSINFEGGFYYIRNKSLLQTHPKYNENLDFYKNFLFFKRISMNEYLEKIKKSMFVFNTPAVLECHGWKLAEYLCMGKAIISTPLSRAMPTPIDEIDFIEIVNNEQELNDVIIKLKSDPLYLKELETKSKKYFNEYLSPEKVISKIINII